MIYAQTFSTRKRKIKKSSDDETEEEDNSKTVKVVCDDANYQQLIDFLDEHLFVYEV